VNKGAEADKNNSKLREELHRLTSQESEDVQALDELYHKRAKNMAVVDMRDGYISKVASVSLFGCSLH
jgi:hypothetical protein